MLGCPPLRLSCRPEVTSLQPSGDTDGPTLKRPLGIQALERPTQSQPPPRWAPGRHRPLRAPGVGQWPVQWTDGRGEPQLCPVRRRSAWSLPPRGGGVAQTVHWDRGSRGPEGSHSGQWDRRWWSRVPCGAVFVDFRARGGQPEGVVRTVLGGRWVHTSLCMVTPARAGGGPSVTQQVGAGCLHTGRPDPSREPRAARRSVWGTAGVVGSSSDSSVSLGSRGSWGLVMGLGRPCAPALCLQPGRHTLPASGLVNSVAPGSHPGTPPPGCRRAGCHWSTGTGQGPGQGAPRADGQEEGVEHLG